MPAPDHDQVGEAALLVARERRGTSGVVSRRQAVRLSAILRKDLRMDWDLIADRWAAMTHRLRSDRIGAPRSVGGPLDTRRIPKNVNEEQSDRMTPETVGNDRSLPSSQ